MCMQRTCRLFLLILAGVLFSPALVRAQTQESPVVLSYDDVGVGTDTFQKPYGAQLLPLETRYHAGDNPDWADPAFDDGSWETGVDSWLPTQSLPQQGWPGIGWFRFWVRIDAPLQGESLGFTIYHRGAIEVYLDGTRVFQSGTVGATPDQEEPALDVTPFMLPLQPGQTHLVAVRYSNVHTFDTALTRWLGGSGFRIYWGNRTTMQHHQTVTRLNEGLYVGFFLAFSVLFGLLFVLYREERLFLYSALWNACWAPAVLIISEVPFMHGSAFLMPLWGFWSMLVVGGSLALLRLLYAFFYSTLPKMFYAYLIGGLVTISLVVFRFENTPYISLFFIPFFVEVFRIVVVALWQRKRWAWVVGLGFLPIIVIGLIEMSNELGWLVAPWADTAFESGMIGVFALSASLAIYVGMRFADANRNLAQANQELTEANQNLDEANRTLEERVEERTAKLRASQAQLIQSEKMASLGQLTAGIAHEIKNPLNFVNNFAELSAELADELAEELDVNTDKSVAEIRGDLADILADLKQNAFKINEHGRRADGIIQSMLAHARSTLGERVATDLNALLDDYVNLAFHGMCAQNEDFRCDIKRNYDEAISTVELVPQEIGRVFQNLLKNAFEAVYERVQHDNGAYIPTVWVTTRQVNGAVTIQVRDNGTGIPPAIQDKIFEPFFTTKPTGTGTGLGLSLSYDIVTQGYGGMLAVESEEGNGATFLLTLPTTQMEAVPKA